MTVLVLFVLLTTAGTWQHFSEWFSKHGTPGAPAGVVKSYSDHLKRSGVSPDTADAHAKEIQQYIAAHGREALVLHFNRMYTWADAPFSREPSALVTRVASARKPGRALYIAMGQGRNAIWLAKSGWTVSGYDISPEALRQASAAAASAGLKLDTTLASHGEYELGQAQWDLIVMSFAFTSLGDTAYMTRVRDSLKPGGVLIVEGFNGGRRTETNMILKAFLDYRVLVFEDLPAISDWGKMKAPLLRMALEKP